MSGEPPHTNKIFLEAIIFEGGLLLLAVGLAWLLGYGLSSQVKYRWQAFGLAVASSCPPLLALIWCTRSGWKPLARLFQEIEDQILPLFASCSIFDFAGISILAGVAEEALFRGVLQNALADSLGAPLALLAASTLFGLAHFITPAYAFLASVLGVYLGGLLVISGNLLVPILVHTIYDFVALAYLTRKYK